ncbi:MAG: hypothetical protein FRX49_05623 [Trebouxia sp. A1-2]|nr:MAG: hypothetical protein FRX49_05623 [Trebouxia sp. A1-2]
MKIRLDEDLSLQQMKTRRGLPTDFESLKARGYKPFFRGPTLISPTRYKAGALIRKCAWARPWPTSLGQANKVVAAAARAARTAPPPPRQQQAQDPRTIVAMDPSVLLHQRCTSTS